MSLLLLIESNGEFSALNADLKYNSAPDASPDAILVLPPFAALRMALHGTLDTSQITMHGDADLATSVGKVLRELSWDAEEDLSHLVGDIPATKIISMGKQFLQQGKQQSANLAAMLAEVLARKKIPSSPSAAIWSNSQHKWMNYAMLRKRLAKRIARLDKSHDK